MPCWRASTGLCMTSSLSSMRMVPWLGPVIAGDHLDEGGFARAIVAHEAHDLARRERQ